MLTNKSETIRTLAYRQISKGSLDYRGRAKNDNLKSMWKVKNDFKKKSF
jgi:hypothetical protein